MSRGVSLHLQMLPVLRPCLAAPYAVQPLSLCHLLLGLPSHPACILHANRLRWLLTQECELPINSGAETLTYFQSVMVHACCSLAFATLKSCCWYTCSHYSRFVSGARNTCVVRAPALPLVPAKIFVVSVLSSARGSSLPAEARSPCTMQIMVGVQVVPFFQEAHKPMPRLQVFLLESSITDGHNSA